MKQALQKHDRKLPDIGDYQDRSYLSVVEAARYLNTTVSIIHELVNQGQLEVTIAASGQQRFVMESAMK